MNHHRHEFGLPFDQAVRMFTIWAAAAAHQESERGSIEVGKVADFCVVSDDPSAIGPEKIPDLGVAQTWVAGEIAHAL